MKKDRKSSHREWTIHKDIQGFFVFVLATELREYMNVEVLTETKIESSRIEIEHLLTEKKLSKKELGLVLEPADHAVNWNQVSRQALFLAAYGFIESSVTSFIEVTLEPDHEVKLQDLRGSGLVRCELYLKKVSRIRNRCALLGSPQLPILNKIRNIIAHGAGMIPDGQSENLRKLVADSGYNESTISIDKRVNLGPKAVSHIVLEGVQTLWALDEQSRIHGYYTGPSTRLMNS